jgi:hypothetical protein
VCLVGSRTKLRGAAQAAGEAVAPVEVTVVLHVGPTSEEGGLHDLVGRGRGTEADGAKDSSFAEGEEGQTLLGHKVIQLEFVPVVRQDGSPQVAVTADVDVGLAVPARVLDQGGAELGLETIEVS